MSGNWIWRFLIILEIAITIIISLLSVPEIIWSQMRSIFNIF